MMLFSSDFVCMSIDVVFVIAVNGTLNDSEENLPKPDDVKCVKSSLELVSELSASLDDDKLSSSLLLVVEEESLSSSSESDEFRSAI